MKPRLLDLFCGAGGAAMGYHRAGFDVVGVDNRPQPRYPFEFVQADALDFLRQRCDHVQVADAVVVGSDLQGAEDRVGDLVGRAAVAVGGFDVQVNQDRAGHGVSLSGISESSNSRYQVKGFAAIHASPPCQRWVQTGMYDRSIHPDLLTPTRQLLTETGLPWVIENVPGAPMRPDAVLCGSMFGLEVRRHRWFEFSWAEPILTLACDHSRRAVGVYGHPRGRRSKNGQPWGWGNHEDWVRAMGIDWMRGEELAQAIPPAYTELIGHQLAQHIRVAA